MAQPVVLRGTTIVSLESQIVRGEKGIAAAREVKCTHAASMRFHADPIRQWRECNRTTLGGERNPWLCERHPDANYCRFVDTHRHRADAHRRRVIANRHATTSSLLPSRGVVTAMGIIATASSSIAPRCGRGGWHIGISLAPRTSWRRPRHAILRHQDLRRTFACAICHSPSSSLSASKRTRPSLFGFARDAFG